MDARQVVVSPSHEHPCRNRYEATRVQLPGAGVRAPASGMGLIVTTRTPTTPHVAIATMLISVPPVAQGCAGTPSAPFADSGLGASSSSAIPTDGAPPHSGSGRGTIEQFARGLDFARCLIEQPADCAAGKRMM